MKTRNETKEFRYKGCAVYRVGISWYILSPLAIHNFAGMSIAASKAYINSCIGANVDPAIGLAGQILGRSSRW